MDQEKKIDGKEEENIDEKTEKKTLFRPESKDNQITVFRRESKENQITEVLSSEDIGECSSSNLSLPKEIVQTVLDSKKQKTVNINIAKNIHVGDKFYLQGSSHDIRNLHKLNPMQTISNNYEELFTMWKERLMKHYKTDNAYMRSLFWENKRNDFPIKEYFVDLKVQKSELLGFKTREYVQLKQIFQKDVRHHVIILVTGHPGYGKSTLCKKIAYDWGEDDPNNDYLSHFDFVAVIVLRELEGRTVINAVLDKLSNSDDDSYSTIKKELRKAKFNFLVILDGFDETFDKSSVINFIKNDSVEISKNMTILVTSRPYVTEEIREYVTDRFSLEGFSRDQRRKYIELVFKENVEKINDLVNFMKTDLYIELGQCPLMLHMLCCLSGNEDLKKINTKTDLYVQIFRLIINRYRKKKGVKHVLKKGENFYGEDILIKLGELIHEERYIYIIRNKDLKRKFCIQQEYEFIVSLDIFSICFEKNDNVYFSILHDTFAEFIKSLYIYNCCISNPHVKITYFTQFVFGLFSNRIFPENVIRNIKNFIFDIRSWFLYYKEIKDNNNKQLFLLNRKLLFQYVGLDYFEQIIKSFQFTQIYVVFPKSTPFYHIVQHKLKNIHKNFNYSNEFEIFFILDLSHSYQPFNSTEGFRDIRDIATMITNLLNSYSWTKFKFYLIGIYPDSSEIGDSISMSDIHVFTKIENPAIITKEIREELIKSNEELVSLHSINKSFTFSYNSSDEQDDLLTFKNGKKSSEMQNLISAEVFENLKAYIKLDLEDTSSV